MPLSIHNTSNLSLLTIYILAMTKTVNLVPVEEELNIPE